MVERGRADIHEADLNDHAHGPVAVEVQPNPTLYLEAFHNLMLPSPDADPRTEGQPQSARPV